MNHAWFGREGTFSVSKGIKKLLLTRHRQGYFTYSLSNGVLGIVHQLVISAIIGYCFRFHSRLSSCLKLNIWIRHKRGEVVSEAVGRGWHDSGDERGLAQVEN